MHITHQKLPHYHIPYNLSILRNKWTQTAIEDSLSPRRREGGAPKRWDVVRLRRNVCSVGLACKLVEYIPTIPTWKLTRKVSATPLTLSIGEKSQNHLRWSVGARFLRNSRSSLLFPRSFRSTRTTSRTNVPKNSIMMQG